MTANVPEISGNLTLNLQQQLARVASQWTTHQGIQGSAIDGLELIRCNEPSSCGSSVYEPSLCFVIQGTKTIQLGDREITYQPCPIWPVQSTCLYWGELLMPRRNTPIWR